MGDRNELERKKFVLEIAIAARNFEIELFWKRSLFFWGFIVAAFGAYATLDQPALRVIAACFGLVCSVAWSLLNRGSKYWQEQWESKVERFEGDVTGMLFASREPRQKKGAWLSGARFSVSKLAIALSDYVLVLWSALVIWEIGNTLWGDAALQDLRVLAVRALIVFSMIYVVLMALYAHSTDPKRKAAKEAEKMRQG